MKKKILQAMAIAGEKLLFWSVLEAMRPKAK